MTDDATYARPAAAPRYSESLHVLLDEPTRAAVMGLAVSNARSAGDGIRPREGEAVRELLGDALSRVREAVPDLYEKWVTDGRNELAKRK